MTSAFVVEGDPAAIEVAASRMRAHAETFLTVADSLAYISAEGWSGRAADRFRERFEVEPQRWRDAGDGFRTAAGALAGYAAALRTAQERAQWCAKEHARGIAVTGRARAHYEADVAQGRAEQHAWEMANGPGSFTLTVHPFVDPGEPIRAGARAEFEAAVADLENAAEDAARRVRLGCEAAPEKRNWLESGAAFVGGVFAGAGEAIGDLVELVSSVSPARHLFDLASGDLTTEELAATYRLRRETAVALAQAAADDPVGFGKQVGASLLDVDTWKDDPARALGALVPDALLAYATGGTAPAASRLGSGAARLGHHADDVTGGARVADDAQDLAHLRRLDGADRLDDLGAAGRSDGAGGTGYRSHLYDPSNPNSVSRLLDGDYADAEHWRQRVEAGRRFNTANHHRFPANEVRLENGRVLDSLDPVTRSSVSRKHTDLNVVQPSTARRYIDEVVAKYGPDEVIADTPANRSRLEAAGLESLIGQKLQGQMVLEVPPHARLPDEILEYAAVERQVDIVDPAGRNYTDEWKAAND